MKKIGLMGGTFNPVHNAHLIMAEYAKEQYCLDYVIFMTSGNPPHKRDIDMPDASVRHEMLCLALKEDKDFISDDYEVKLSGYSYSVNTLKYLNEKYPDDDIYFIVGCDSLADFPKWYKPDEILKLCTVLVYPRSNNTDISEQINIIQNKYGGKIYSVNAPLVGISSTEIRERIRSGKSIRHMIPENVFKYIEKNGLYMEKK